MNKCEVCMDKRELVYPASLVCAIISPLRNILI